MRNLILIFIYLGGGLLNSPVFGMVDHAIEKDTLLIPTVVRRNVITQEKISINSHRLEKVDSVSKFSGFVIPTAFISYGVATQFIGGLQNIDRGAHRWVSRHIDKRVRIDDFIQYAPGLGVYGLALTGLEPEHNLKQRTIVMATSHLLMGAVVQGMKHSIKVHRPDGSNYKSFPSGHTAMAFVGAHILHKEYKAENPWIGVAGYAVATATGALRVVNKKHWVSDVLTGAGIGILSAEVGYMLLPKIENWFRPASATHAIKLQRVSYEDGSGFSLSYNF